jgi:ABC-type branched-chain amino acid transport systems, periplasmic component
VAEYAHDTLHVQRVAVVDDRTAYGQGLADVFSAKAKKLGMDVVDREYTDDKSTDFSAILTRIKADHPQVIFYGGMYSQAGPLVRQMRQIGMTARLMGATASARPSWPRWRAMRSTARSAPRAARRSLSCPRARPGRRVTTPSSARPPSSSIHPTPLMQPWCGPCDDESGSSDPKVYLPYIRHIDYDGVTDSDIHFTATGELADPSITLSEFEHGVKVPLAVEQVR